MTFYCTPKFADLLYPKNIWSSRSKNKVATESVLRRSIPIKQLLTKIVTLAPDLANNYSATHAVSDWPNKRSATHVVSDVIAFIWFVFIDYCGNCVNLQTIIVKRCIGDKDSASVLYNFMLAPQTSLLIPEI